jgi:hypothetical protein
MSDCCSVTNESCVVPQTGVANTAVCPFCGQKGKSVDTQTVKAVLAISLDTINTSAAYRFCRTPDCPVVYYDEERRFFTEAHLRQRVHQKHPEVDDVFVCYCYRYTPGSIRAEWVAHGYTDVVARVTAGTKAGTCACEIRNPQGNCCLGNLRAVVKQIKADFQPSA